MRMHKLLISVLLVACVAAVPMPDPHQSQDLNCLEDDNQLYSCIMVKTYAALDKATRMDDVDIFDGVKFTRTTLKERTSRAMQISEQAVMNELPDEFHERMFKLGSMIFDSASSFIRSHKLELSVPTELTKVRSLAEGRAKLKKMLMPFIATVGIKLLALAPLVLGALALLATKALFVGKAALLLSGILAFQKFMSYGSTGGFPKTPQYSALHDNSAGWSNIGWSNAGTQGYNRNLQENLQSKLDVRADAQKLVYSAYAPGTATHTN